MKTPALASILIAFAIPTFAASPQELAPDAAARFADLALQCVHREYPNKIAHVMRDDEDARPPRELTPAFFGCFDWHSAVHAHWMLARLARLFPDAPFAAPAREALARSLTRANLLVEAKYLSRDGRETFERPYGLAWLLQLAAELHEWDVPPAQAWSDAIDPLARLAARRLREWLPKLSHPIRTGEHSQSAFALGLALDWARTVGARGVVTMIGQRTREMYLDDRDCPLEYEPSGQDFLSPCLAEADLMRRILSPPAFAAWLGGFLPGLPYEETANWLPIAVVTDPTDGKLAHLDGLNLSRAWMLEGIARGLPEPDPRRPGLIAAAAAHRRSGLASVTGQHYEGGHWLGSFATYLMTGRGLGGGPDVHRPISDDD